MDDLLFKLNEERDQLTDRLTSLDGFISDYNAGKSGDVKLVTPMRILVEQQRVMREYRMILDERIAILEREIKRVN